MVEFTLFKWYNSQFLLFRNVKSCLRGNSYIHDKLENNLEAIYIIYWELKDVGVILRQFGTWANRCGLVLVQANSMEGQNLWVLRISTIVISRDRRKKTRSQDKCQLIRGQNWPWVLSRGKMLSVENVKMESIHTGPWGWMLCSAQCCLTLALQWL